MLLPRRTAAQVLVAILLLSTFSPASVFADTAFSLDTVRYHLTYVASQLASLFSDLADAIASHIPTTSLTATAAAPTPSPIAPPTPAPGFLATTTPEASTPPTTTTAPDAPQTTIIQQPVIERIVEKAVPQQSSAAVSPSTLAVLLANLRYELLSRINAVASAPIAFSGPAATTPVSVATFAPSQRIDQLTNTSITNPTITGGSISGTSITGTITNVINSTLATIDDLTSNTITATNASFTNATTTNLAVTNLTASATSTLSGLKLAATDCSVLGNGGKLTTDAFGVVVCAADQGGAGGSVGGLDTQVQFNDGGVFGGNAGFTYNKTAQRATVTYASTTAITASYASSTAGYFGALSAGTLSLVAPLSAASGGTGTSTPAAWGNILYWNGTNWQGLATSSLGITSAWGSITGTLSNQTDLQSALDAKLSLSSWYATTTTALAEGNNLYFTTNRVAGVLAGTTTDALAQGSTNKYYATTLFATDLAATTTSALAEGSNLYYTANRAAGVIAGTTTDALAEGSSRLYFTNARADARINATSTIGTLTSAPNLTTLATSLTGFLKAASGVLSTALINLASDVTGILPVPNGGTGWANIAAGAIPYGNGSGALATTSAASGGQVLAYLNGTPMWTATTTFSAPLSYAGGAVSIAQANGSTNGYLASVDWSLFNNKVSSSSLSATYPLAYNSATGVFSSAFSTSTANNWSALQQFTAGATSSALTVSGTTWLTSLGTPAGTFLAVDNDGKLIATSTPAVGGGGTVTNVATNATLTGGPITTTGTLGLNLNNANWWTATQNFSHASTSLFTATSSVWFTALTSSLLATDDTGKLVATTSIGANLLSGTLGVANGGTGSSTLSGILKGNGASAVQSASAGTDYELPLSFNAPLSRLGNAVSLSTAGDWSGTLGGFSAAQLIALGFSTTSADAWKATRSFFATSSSDFWLGTKTTDALAQGSTNKYYATTLFATDLAATTTSALAEGSNLYYTANRVAGVIAGTTTDALAEGSSRLYFTNARADARINATSTIGTLTSAPNLATVAASLTGFLKATAGALSTAAINLTTDIAGILPVANGGTGWSSIAAGAIPYGNGSSALATTSAASGGQVLAFLNGVPTWTATTTFSAPLSYANGAVSLTQASGSTNGYLASSDWSLFNTKIASTSLSAAYPLTYNSSTGVFSSAFSTTTENSFNQLQTFTSGFLANSSSTVTTGLLSMNGGASSTILSASTLCFTADTCRTAWPSASAAWPWTMLTTFGTTTDATTTPTWFQMGLYASSTSQFANIDLTNGTSTAFAITSIPNSILSTNVNGSIVATTSIGVNYLTGTLGIAQGGTGTSTQVTNGVSYFDGSRITNGTAFTFTGTNLGVGTTTPWGTISISTSNTANPQFVIASSTAVNFIVDKSGNIGVGTTSSASRFNIQGAAGTSAFAVASSTGAPMLTVNADGSLSAKLKQLTADYTVDSGSASISVGDLVSYINGNVQKATATVGAASSTTATSSASVGAATLDSTHFVLAFDTNSGSGFAYAVVATVSGTSITYGTPKALNAVASAGISVAALNSTKFVVTYTSNVSGYPCAVVSTVSGTTITAGTPVTLTATAINYSGTVAALDSTHFVTTYGASAVSAVVSTVSGTTITPGTPSVISSYNDNSYVAALDSTHFVAAYVSGFSGYPTAVVSTVSGGTTITPGTEAWLTIQITQNVGSIAKLDSTHFVVPYYDSSYTPHVIAASVSGTTITPGTAVTLESIFLVAYVSATAIDSTHFVVSLTKLVSPGNAVALVGAVSGGTGITTGGPITLNNVVSYPASVTVLDSTHFVTGYYDSTNGREAAVVAQPLLPNILGMATNAASAGGTVTVASNGIVSGLSGLTAGAQYYYDLSTGATTTPEVYRIGTAISSTQMLLDSGAGSGNDQFFGDAVFANAFRIAEGWDAPQSLVFKNQLGRQIMSIDENGNLSITSAFSGGISSSTLSNILATSTTADAYDFVGGVMSAIGDRLGFTSASSTTATTSTSNAISTSTTIDSYATRFIHAIFAQISAWFADASNGIGDFFAATVHAHKLCADDICVTRDELAAMVAAASQSGVFPSSNAHEGAPQVPVIELNGSASSTIEVGDSYNDLGARIVAPTSDLNLGLTIILDGATTTQVSIDTSTPGVRTIIYTVTSPATGLSGSIMRTVVVSPAEQSLEPRANDTPFNAPANDNASSTTAVDAAA